MSRIEYEWTCEIVESGEVMDSVQFSSLGETLVWSAANPPADGQQHDFAVVRYAPGDPMLWAYVVDGKLSACFGDGCDGVTTIRVPQRFRREFENLSGILPN